MTMLLIIKSLFTVLNSSVMRLALSHMQLIQVEVSKIDLTLQELTQKLKK